MALAPMTFSALCDAKGHRAVCCGGVVGIMSGESLIKLAAVRAGGKWKETPRPLISWPDVRGHMKQ